MGRVALCSLALASLGCAARSQVPPDVAFAAALAGTVKVVPNVPYGASGQQVLDLYLLKTPIPPPVLLYFHGGGWTGHAKEEMGIEILPYLALGFAVANVEYRLAAEARAPAAVEDARCALRWIIQNGSANYLDPSRIVLAGGSAGGHLALIAGMAPTGGDFDRACPPAPGDPPPLPVRAILNWGGPGDLSRLAIGPESRDFAREWLGVRDGSEPELSEAQEHELRERAEWLSPRRYVHPGGPPVITVHGDSDLLIPYDQAVSLHADLDRAGVRNRLVTIRGGGHGGFDLEALTQAFQAIREFLAECGLELEPPVP